MGSELYRMIRDGAPASWTPAMRTVALMIADDARDPGQGLPDDGGWPWSAIRVRGHYAKGGEWRDGLTERTGLRERAISRALTDLARAGYEMREQIGTDKRERPVFAYPWRARRFRVPLLPPRRPPDPATYSTPDPATYSTPDPATYSTPDPATLSPPDTATAGQVARSGSDGRHIWSSQVATDDDPVSPGLPRVSPASQSSVVNGSLEGVRDGQGDDDSETRSAPKPGQRGSCGVCGGTRYRVGDDGLLAVHGPRRDRCKGSRQPPAEAEGAEEGTDPEEGTDDDDFEPPF